VSKQLSEINGGNKLIVDISPQSIVAIADTTFFARSYGVTIFRDPIKKKNLIWKEVHSETPEQYRRLRNELELEGVTLKAIVLDGRRGVREVFSDIPIQMCQFHQVAIIVRYLTRHPQLEAGKELKQVALQLTKCTEQEFKNLPDAWHDKWKGISNSPNKI
jgi:hypothetical protein